MRFWNALISAAVLVAVMVLGGGCSDVVGNTDEGIDCTQFPDGTECDDPNDDVRQVCLAGTCVLTECGDGLVDADGGEQCEPEGAEDPTCENDCTFVCTEDADCDDGNQCTAGEVCEEDHSCTPGTDLSGDSCTLANGGSGICLTGLCVRPGCNDGVLGEGEECDDGNRENGDGCDADCTFSCTDDAECTDGDPCTGVETCDPETHACVIGTPLECTPPDACSVSVCDPDTGNCVDSVDPAVDGDGDGYAADTVLVCGNDCDDTDPEINPGHIEVCGDGKDNNCFDGTNDEAVQTWWADCDGDGFAGSGAITMMACAKPLVTTAGCPTGFGDWTPVNPNTSQTTDCADLAAEAYPGAEEFHTQTIPGTASYDWNCDSTAEQRYPPNPPCMPFCLIKCFFIFNCDSSMECCTFGSGSWRDAGAPPCGNSAVWEYCGDESLGFCTPDESRTQECR